MTEEASLTNFSTVRMIKDVSPSISSVSPSPFASGLFLPPRIGRKGEGGLRTRGLFKRGGYFDSDVPGDDTPLFSIVTVVFNGEAHLEQSLLSVLNQAYPNVEYIVVDGGSTDGTLDIIRKYDEAIDYWVSEPDQGIGDGFNKGISLSTGKIIGIINADDWYENNAFEQVVWAYRQNPESIIHGDLQFWTNSKPAYVFHGRDDLAHLRPTINHPTVFVPRTVYDVVGPFLPEFRKAMDFEWLGRAKMAGIPFVHLDSVLANMRRGGVSDKKWLESYIEAAKARQLHGVSTIYNLYLFLKSAFLTLGRKTLEILKLESLIQIYRKYWSIGKKRNIKHTL